MNLNFQKNVSELGGKHGGIVSLQDGGLGDLVLPMHIIRPGEQLSETQLRELEKWGEKYGLRNFIVRTSHPGDFNGLVDVMPTYKGITKGKVQGVLDEVSQELGNGKLKKYAKCEGIDFDTQDCTISVSPEIYTKTSTITEHPNAFGTMHMMVDTLNGEFFDTQDYSGTDIPKHIRELTERIGNIVGDDSIVLQLETSDARAQVNHVFQVRKFSDKKPHELYHGKLTTENNPNARMFGTTATEWSEEDITYFKSVGVDNNLKYDLSFGLLPVRAMDEACNLYEKLDIYSEISDGNDCIIYHENMLSEMNGRLTYHQPTGMKIYLGASSTPALAHMHTRYIQQSLRNHGASYLTTRGLMDMSGPLELVHCFGIKHINLPIIPGKKPYGFNC